MLELEEATVLAMGKDLLAVLVQEGSLKASFSCVPTLKVPHVDTCSESTLAHREPIVAGERLVVQAFLVQSFQVFWTHILGVGTRVPVE
jgi:hypothetical protein